MKQPLERVIFDPHWWAGQPGQLCTFPISILTPLGWSPGGDSCRSQLLHLSRLTVQRLLSSQVVPVGLVLPSSDQPMRVPGGRSPGGWEGPCVHACCNPQGVAACRCWEPPPLLFVLLLCHLSPFVVVMKAPLGVVVVLVNHLPKQFTVFNLYNHPGWIGMSTFVLQMRYLKLSLNMKLYKASIYLGWNSNSVLSTRKVLVYTFPLSISLPTQPFIPQALTHPFTLLTSSSVWEPRGGVEILFIFTSLTTGSRMVTVCSHDQVVLEKLDLTLVKDRVEAVEGKVS